MKFEIEIPDYTLEQGVTLEWDAQCKITVASYGTEAVIRANSAGLITLARHCLTLAQQGIPDGFNFRYAANTELEPDSIGLVLELDDEQRAGSGTKKVSTFK